MAHAELNNCGGLQDGGMIRLWMLTLYRTAISGSPRSGVGVEA
jgi:hypothetical protein